VEQIPCGEQIKNIVDDIAPAELAGAFEKAHAIAGEQGILESCRVLFDGVLIALDGTWYFSSRKYGRHGCIFSLRAGTKATRG
jgi:hypothetical protein